MKESPIIFSAPMVLANRAGTKTMTRRTAGLKKVNQSPDDWEFLGVPYGIWRFQNKITKEYITLKCPYGGVGDLMWVRETFCEHTTGGVIYKADEKPCEGVYSYHTWRPSIHMPRWASRTDLEITGIKCERVQGISFDDVIAEGLNPLEDCRGTQRPLTEARWLYQELWDSIYLKRGYGWEANPFVWAISYRSCRE